MRARVARAILAAALLVAPSFANPSRGGEAGRPEAAAQEAQDEVDARIDELDARLDELDAERRSVSLDEPGREDRLRLVDLEYSLLQERRLQLERAAADAALAPQVTAEAIDELRARHDAARTALDRLDEEAEVAGLRGRPDLEDLRQAVEATYRAPLEQAERDTAGATEQLEAARTRLDALPAALSDARTRLESRRRQLEQAEEGLTATTDAEERALLQRNVEVLRLAVELLTERQAFLVASEPFLQALVQRRELELQLARIGEKRLERLYVAAQGIVDARIQVAQEDAEGRLEYLRTELERTTAPYLQRRLRWEIEDARLTVSFARSVGLREENGRRIAALEEARVETQRVEELLTGDVPALPVTEARPSVRDTIARLQARANRAEQRVELTRLRADRETWAAALEEARRALDELDGAFEAARDAARAEIEAADRSAEWSREAARWLELKQARRDLLERRAELFGDLVADADDIERLLVQVFSERREALIRIQRAHLFLRTDAKLTLEKVTQGLEDLAALPGRSVELGQGVLRWGARPGVLPAILWSALLSLLLTLIAWLVDRRFDARLERLRDLEDDDDRSDRAAVVLVRLTRALMRGAAFYLVFLVWARLLPELPVGVAGTLREVGFVLGLLWFVKCCVLVLLAPDARGRLLLPLDVESARRARTAGLALVYASALFVPVIQGLRRMGYANLGAIEALELVYRLFVVAALLTVLLRRSTLAGFLPKGEGPAARLARRVLQLLYPVLVLGVPGLLVLDLLRYDILAGLIARNSILTLIVALATYLLYLGAQYLVDRQLEAAEDGADEPAFAYDYGGPQVFAHFVLRLVALVGGASALLFLAGSSLADVEGFLSIPLPMQDPASERVVTLWNLLVGLVLLVLTVQGVRHVRGALQTIVLPRTRLDVGLQYTIATIVGYALMAGGLALALGQVFALERLGYVVAALSIGIGFGLQEIVSNFISGLILLFERPLRVGDMVDVGGTDGVVKRIQIRSTTLQTRDNVWILVPNKDFITQNVKNYVYTDAKMRIHVQVGVAYGTETALVRKALLEVAREHGKVLKRPGPEVWFLDFGDSALVFDLLCWVGDPINRWRIMSDLRYAIDASFRRYGIQIPFPQRDLHVRSVRAPFHVTHDPVAQGPHGPGDTEDAADEPTDG